MRKIFLAIFLVLGSAYGYFAFEQAKGSGGEQLGDAIYSGDVSTIRRQVRNLGSADISRSNNGVTILMDSIWAGDLNVVQTLIDLGADVNRANPAGWTSLMMAARADRADLVELLLSAGADPDLRNDMGNTAAQIALDNGNTQLAAKIRGENPALGGQASADVTRLMQNVDGRE